MKSTRIIVVVAVLALAAAVFAQSTASSGQSSAPKQDLTRGSSILVDYCSACHDWAQDYDSIMASGVIVPGNVEKSLVWKMISSGRMPAAGDPPTAEEKQLIHDWIEAGAPAPAKK